MPLEIIPAEIIQKYKLQDLAHTFFVYMEIWRFVYGLTQAGKIANYKIKLHLAKFGY